jgi:hypothetical protein
MLRWPLVMVMQEIRYAQMMQRSESNNLSEGLPKSAEMVIYARSWLLSWYHLGYMLSVCVSKQSNCERVHRRPHTII